MTYPDIEVDDEIGTGPIAPFNLTSAAAVAAAVILVVEVEAEVAADAASGDENDDGRTSCDEVNEANCSSGCVCGSVK